MIDEAGLDTLIQMYGPYAVIPALLRQDEVREFNERMEAWKTIVGTAEWYEQKRKIVIEILNREGRS